NKHFGTYLKSALAVAAIIVILLVKPWEIEFHSTKDAMALENRIAVLYFENLAIADDPERTGEIITDLLITDLSQSEYIQVLSYQRLNDILKYIEQQDGNQLNETTSSQVAKLGRANWILAGKIHQIKPQLIVTAQLTNIASDDIVQSYQIEANSDENLFTMVDKLTKNVKKDLSLPSSALNESDSPIADVTTHSQNAYLHYLEGIDFYNRFYNEDAKRSFQMAINYDSTYAMAYYYLATLDNTNRHDLISKAVEYSGKINIKEQLYIKSRAAAVAGDHNLAMDFLSKLIKQYPDEK
ncbi:MAG: hypothetical protein GY865_07640, partial [candidate division Zixibacteria bacterium]|nr:hypothetical protein [candidate division Zixibacteria bacterium]